MMVEIHIAYEGRLRCTATHGPSQVTLSTDAPVDNLGRGESFSPTDLVATALGTCILTVMGIYAQRYNLDLRGATVKVGKEMVQEPHRRIGRLPVEVYLPFSLAERHQTALEKAAYTCPVHKSLHPEIEAPITFYWDWKE